jgi:hypothetical protein
VAPGCRSRQERRFHAASRQGTQTLDEVLLPSIGVAPSPRRPSLLRWFDKAREQPVELLPLGLGELSEELQGVGVDCLLGPGSAPSFRPP